MWNYVNAPCFFFFTLIKKIKNSDTDKQHIAMSPPRINYLSFPLFISSIVFSKTLKIKPKRKKKQKVETFRITSSSNSKSPTLSICLLYVLSSFSLLTFLAGTASSGAASGGRCPALRRIPRWLKETQIPRRKGRRLLSLTSVSLTTLTCRFFFVFLFS